MDDDFQFSPHSFLLDENQVNFSPMSKFFASRSGFADTARESFQDFGRESLGLLDFNHPDFQRDSLAFLHNTKSSDLPRESLGILDLDGLDLARESLGVSCNIPEIQISNLSSSAHLNTAFIMSSKLSASSSTSSLNPSFNFESTSRIFSITPSTINNSTASKNDILNDAFGDTSVFLQQLQHSNGRFSISTIYNALESRRNENIHHLRIHSLPSTLETRKEEVDVLVPHCNNNNNTISPATAAPDDDVFEDSVFIEANHVAARLSDISILAENSSDDDMLDSIHEPEDLLNVIDDVEPAKYDTETVFKIVDKVLPPETTEKQQKDSVSSASSGSPSKSKDAAEILHNLTEILNTEARSEQQKNEGKQLISSLAEILISGNNTPKSENLDDSGLSADSNDLAAPQSHVCYEVLDLRISNVTSENSVSMNCSPLDLSLKSRSDDKDFQTPRELAPKTNNNKRLSMSLNVENQKRKEVSSSVSVSTAETRSFSSLSNKFKPKKTEEKKKGPLKAVIPVTNMKRYSGGFKGQNSPARLDPKSNYKYKKTSTPIAEPKLKPMAQSTPGVYPSSPYQMSPLAKSSNNSIEPKDQIVVKQKLNYSDSFENRSIRRRSVSDVKKPAAATKNKVLVRSFSTGRDSSIQASASKAREIVNKKRRSLNMSCDNVLRENVKTVSKLPSFKKIGKENAVH